jgi:hypothetical protein
MILKFSRPPSAEYKSDNLKLEAGQGDKTKPRLCGQYLFECIVSQWKTPAPNTQAARTTERRCQYCRED